VAGRAAEGLDWVRAFDNGSYLSPILYAVDLLHALAALPTLAEAMPGVRVDLQRVAVGGYSQGGDVALTALAAASAAQRPLRLRAGVIWAGCFAGRLEQARFYGGMEGSADALRDPAFFAHMPSWWKPSMYRGSIAEGIAHKHRQLLDTVRRHVAEPGDVSVQALAPQLARIDAFTQPERIQAPLQLHYSDQDHYSPPAWNEALARAVAVAGGRAEAHPYRGNTHGFGIEPGWSPAGAVAGRALSIERSLAFTGRAN
jgi:dienelactone hydrolase